MSEPQVEKVELRITMAATISEIDPVTGDAVTWMKPATSVACTWAGMPSMEEMVRQYQILSVPGSAILEETVRKTHEEMAKLHSVPARVVTRVAPPGEIL